MSAKSSLLQKNLFVSEVWILKNFMLFSSVIQTHGYFDDYGRRKKLIWSWGYEIIILFGLP